MRVLGRVDGDGPVAHLGNYRARDGSPAARVGVDLDRPHVVLIVGKRGAGKSYTMGVLAEELARTGGVCPIVGDTMGVFRSLAAAETIPGRTVEPAIPADAISPPTWCGLLGLDPSGAAGTLVWRAAAEADSLAEMAAVAERADATRAARRAAWNHLSLADRWGVFDPDAAPLSGDAGGVRLPLAGRDRAAMNAVVAGVADRCYERCVAAEAVPLPWLLLDEAHVFFDGVASTALRRLLTRGRGPGVSLVAATQRPGTLPATALSQADLLVVHRLTGRADREALASARPTYLSGALEDRVPGTVGEALVIDDATETVNTVTVRERLTPHDGSSPRASARAGASATHTDIETVE
jgi:DNA helicase HerA-like ATPase